MFLLPWREPVGRRSQGAAHARRGLSNCPTFRPCVETLEGRCLPAVGLFVASFDSGQVLRYDSTTGAFLGTFAAGLADDHPLSLTVGRDGNLYVGVNNFGGGQASFIRRFDGETGTFIDTFASGGGLAGPGSLTFGPDGNLYVASFGPLAMSKVIRYNGTTGAYIDDFVPVGSGGLTGIEGLLFGPDGNLYVTSRVTNQVLRYDGSTGAFLGVFATTRENNGPIALTFGPDHNLYVLDNPNDLQVERFDGLTGAFIDVFVGRFSGGTDGCSLAFGPDGNLYVSTGFIGNSVERFNGSTGQLIDHFVLRGSGGLSYATDLLFRTAPEIEDPLNGPYDSFALPPCDDCSSEAVPLGFTFDFYGRRFNSAFVNNNGNLTFDGPFGDFIPAPLAGTNRAVLAPFWADVYTAEPGAGRVTYGPGTLDGDPAFGATWEGVAPFLPHGATATFQVVIADHTARLGYFEVQFNYLSLGWDHPDSSDQPPRAGFSNGAGASAELPGSGTFDTLVDTGAQSLRVLRRYTLIIYPGNDGGSPTPGDVFRVVAPAVANPPAFSDKPSIRSGISGTAPTGRMFDPWEVVLADNFFGASREETSGHTRLVLKRVERGTADFPVFDGLSSDDRLLV